MTHSNKKEASLPDELIEASPDPEVEAIILRVVEQLTPVVDRRNAQAFADRCVQEVRRRRRTRVIGICALAACIVIAVSLIGLLGPVAPAYTEAPPPSFSSSNKVLGYSTKGVEANRVSAMVPVYSSPSWLAILQIRNGQPTVRTDSDANCIELLPKDGDKERLLSFPFVVSEKHPTTVLFLWTEKPCGTVLSSAVQDMRRHGFPFENRDRLLEYIALAVRRSGNRLYWYRYIDLDPLQITRAAP